MNRRPNAPESPRTAPDPGQCGGCRHAHRIESDRGTVFWRCRRSETDPRYARYPRLPVIGCPGFEPEPIS